MVEFQIKGLDRFTKIKKYIFDPVQCNFIKWMHKQYQPVATQAVLRRMLVLLS